MYTCAICTKHSCRSGALEEAPKNCPCREEGQERITERYSEEENRAISYASARTEADGYCKKTRLEETIDFAHRMGVQHLGLAFCFGLRKEARILTDILTKNGFRVDSIICKTGSIPKETIGIQDSEKIRPGSYEPMCNPIEQALFLNREKTQLNILFGLCVGHDSLFLKYSEAPVTVFAVKDRVLAHNPLGALYLSDGYYKNKLYPEQD